MTEEGIKVSARLILVLTCCYCLSLVMLNEHPSSCSFGVLSALSGVAEFDILFEFSVDLPIFIPISIGKKVY